MAALAILMFVLVAIMFIISSIWCPFTFWTSVGFALLWLVVPLAYFMYTDIRSRPRVRPSPLWLVLGPWIVWFCGTLAVTKWFPELAFLLTVLTLVGATLAVAAACLLLPATYGSGRVQKKYV